LSTIPFTLTNLYFRTSAFFLLQALSDGNSEVQTALSNLLPTLKTLPLRVRQQFTCTVPALFDHSQDWDSNDLNIMKERLDTLLQNTEESVVRIDVQNFPERPLPLSGIVPAARAPGWQLLNECSTWKPSPIGVYNQLAHTAVTPNEVESEP
jgi:hypothetical protein